MQLDERLYEGQAEARTARALPLVKPSEQPLCCTAEIGTMRAMGVQREGVRNIFLWEALFVALGGTALGLALAAMAMVGLGFVTFAAGGVFGIFLNEGRFAFDLSLLTILFDIALVCLMSVAAVYLPARAAARLQPAEALRAG